MSLCSDGAAAMIRCEGINPVVTFTLCSLLSEALVASHPFCMMTMMTIIKFNDRKRKKEIKVLIKIIFGYICVRSR